MEHHKMSKLLNNSTISKFVTRKSIVVNDLLGGQYTVNKVKTPMLRSDLYDFRDAYLFLWKR